MDPNPARLHREKAFDEEAPALDADLERQATARSHSPDPGKLLRTPNEPVLTRLSARKRMPYCSTGYRSHLAWHYMVLGRRHQSLLRQFGPSNLARYAGRENP